MKALSNVSELGPVKPTFLSGYDLQKHTKGMNKALGLNSATVQMVGHEYANPPQTIQETQVELA